jgi:hypothetical protein
MAHTAPGRRTPSTGTPSSGVHSLGMHSSGMHSSGMHSSGMGSTGSAGSVSDGRGDGVRRAAHETLGFCDAARHWERGVPARGAAPAVGEMPPLSPRRQR